MGRQFCKELEPIVFAASQLLKYNVQICDNYISKYFPCISSSRPITGFTHTTSTLLPAPQPYVTLVEKCRRLDTALQVIKIKYETEQLGEKRQREREQQLQLTD